MKNAEKRRLLEEHYLDFFSLAMSILRDADDAGDAVQEALVHVLTKRHIDNVMSYTYQSVRNASLAIIRHRKRMVPLGENVPDIDLAHEERLKKVRNLCDELPDTMRALVELYDQDGYTLKELAKITNTSASSVRRRIDEAHNILKKRIEEEI